MFDEGPTYLGSPRLQCVALRTLYGGTSPNQKKNYRKVEAGSLGEITAEYEDDLGVRFYMARFPVPGTKGKIYCRVSHQSCSIIEPEEPK